MSGILEFNKLIDIVYLDMKTHMFGAFAKDLFFLENTMILRRKLKSPPRLIPSEDLFFYGLHPIISDNFLSYP